MLRQLCQYEVRFASTGIMMDESKRGRDLVEDYHMIDSGSVFMLDADLWALRSTPSMPCEMKIFKFNSIYDLQERRNFQGL